MSTWVEASASLGAALIAALGGYLAAVAGRPRKPRPAEVGDAIASAFKTLVDELQEENARQERQIRALREDNHRQRHRLHRIDAFVSLLFSHVSALEDHIRRLGGHPTERPPLPDLG